VSQFQVFLPLTKQLSLFIFVNDRSDEGEFLLKWHQWLFTADSSSSMTCVRVTEIAISRAETMEVNWME
jgi:hypothetical protein